MHSLITAGVRVTLTSQSALKLFPERNFTLNWAHESTAEVVRNLPARVYNADWLLSCQKQPIASRPCVEMPGGALPPIGESFRPGRLWTDTTLATKPEVHNISQHCHHRRIEPRPQVTRREAWRRGSWKLLPVQQRNGRTDGHAHRNTTLPYIGGKVITGRCTVVAYGFHALRLHTNTREIRRQSLSTAPWSREAYYIIRPHAGLPRTGFCRIYTRTLSPKNVHLYFSEKLGQKSADFDNFWYILKHNSEEK